MPILGACKLCQEEKELLESHFISRKMYYSGKKRLEYVNRLSTGLNPEEMKAHLLCRKCEDRLAVGEKEVLRHVAPKYVLKGMPLSDRMRVAIPRDHDPSAPRFDARDFNVDTEKFAHFAVGIVWRRAIHTWSPALPSIDLGQFAEDMRRYLKGETSFPDNFAVIVIVCSDTTSRRMWTTPAHGVDGCINFGFHARGIYFRVMMGNLPLWALSARCTAAYCPIFCADCSKGAEEEFKALKQLHEPPKMNRR